MFFMLDIIYQDDMTTYTHIKTEMKNISGEN